MSAIQYFAQGHNCRQPIAHFHKGNLEKRAKEGESRPDIWDDASMFVRDFMTADPQSTPETSVQDALKLMKPADSDACL